MLRPLLELDALPSVQFAPFLHLTSKWRPKNWISGLIVFLVSMMSSYLLQSKGLFLEGVKSSTVYSP